MASTVRGDHLRQQNDDTRINRPQDINDVPDIGDRAGDTLPAAEIVVSDVEKHDIGFSRRGPVLDVGKNLVGLPTGMPFVVHVEIGIGRRPVAHSMPGSDEIYPIAVVDQQMPEIVPITGEPRVGLGNGIAERHDLEGGTRIRSGGS